MPVLHYAGPPLALPLPLLNHFGFHKTLFLLAIEEACRRHPVDYDHHKWTNATIPEISACMPILGIVSEKTISNYLVSMKSARLIIRLSHYGQFAPRAYTRLNYERLGALPGINCVWEDLDPEFLPFAEAVQQ